MAYDFRADSTPILHYRVWAHKKPTRRLHLLWPVYAYRVIAPQIRQHRINVFQKAVLGMCLGGETDPTTIGGLLRIDPDLVTLIFSELQILGLLDHALKVMPHGKQVLTQERDDTPDPGTIAVGYVFQDPWSQRLWPRFEETLEYADWQCSDDSPYPRVALGSKGNPRYFRPFVKYAKGGQDPTPPTARDILDAVFRHRRALRTGPSAASVEMEDEDGRLHTAVTAPHLDRVTTISEEEQPFFLATYLYVFQDEFGAEDWHVCDPFRAGASSFLRRAVLQQIPNDDELESRFNRFIGDEQLQTMQPDSQKYFEALVRGKLRTRIRFESLLERLVALERASEGAHLGQDNRRSTQDMLEHVILEAAKTLERLFSYLLGAYPPAGTWRVFMTADKEYRQEVVDSVAGGLGLSTPIPTPISRVNRWGVKRAAEEARGTLGQLIVATLLSTRIHRDHPLRTATDRAPELLKQLGQLIELRNQSAHDFRSTLNKAYVSRQVEMTYETVRMLARI